MAFNALSLPISGTHVAFAAGALLALALLSSRYRARRHLSYPPGPRPLPLLGNILDIPRSQFALTWTELGRRYGPLTWLTVPGQTFLVLNSFEAAKELLERRGSIYLDRPRWVMLKELIGLSNYLVLSPANDFWRKQRSHLKHALSGAAVKSDYSSLLETKARQYLERCVARPENVLLETNRIIGEVIIKLTYGKLEDAQGRDYIQIITRLLDIMILSLQGYVVDLFPTLQYLPKWLPGMKFKRDAARWEKEIRELEDTVLTLVKANSLSDDPEVQSSYTFKKMQEIHSKDRDEHGVQEQTKLNYLYTGGLETVNHSTETTMQSFIYAMILCPSVQKKAQDEIDRVIGSTRSPTFEDQPDLPFLHAVMLETLRWNPAVSFGVPHVSRKDDVYEGYFIPKGTTVIPNAWGFSRNSKYYTNPSIFDPERHLKESPELDPREFVFGFGRRLCPGKELAFQEVWILAASILWAFEIVSWRLCASALRAELILDVVSHPTPFECQFVPRRERLKDKLEVATN
ncbi:hypothetical protein M407DRAFT_73022 [Tulasnella calospora MUT 4182]|uniref:Cytochrome P450 n=1 Tax=Tulasnella calospora MUT 4182 TaxID=1051891 RepID=A0A0C3QK37_9AGAM|nr:hypothetical protein M407DRAFT_73022 [Tulasnella calospora MUT 4182]